LTTHYDARINKPFYERREHELQWAYALNSGLFYFAMQDTSGTTGAQTASI
jgi:hypothetical protein